MLPIKNLQKHTQLIKKQANNLNPELTVINEERGGIIQANIFKSSKKPQKIDILMTNQQKQKNLKAQFQQQTLDKSLGKTTQFNEMEELQTKSGLSKEQREQQGNTGMENGKKTRYTQMMMNMIEYSQLLFAGLSILFSCFQYDIRVKHLNQQANDFCLNIIAITTIMQMILIVLSYKMELRLQIEQRIYSRADTLQSTGKIKPLIVELIVNFICPNTFCKDITFSILQPRDKVEITHYLNDFLNVWMLIRMYLVLRILLNITQYSDTRANRICRLYGCESGYFYAAKCLMQESPLTCVTILFIFSTVIFGHALRICEESLNWGLQENSQDFGLYWNCWWNIIITMTTVGYGDYFSRTTPGRIIIVITAIWGIFNVSLLVVALQNFVKMNNSEIKALNILHRLQEKPELKRLGAFIITQFVKMAKDVKNKKYIDKKLMKFRIQELKKNIEQFQAISRKVQGMTDQSNISEEMQRRFDYIKDEIKEITINQITLKDYLLKLTQKVISEDIISQDPDLIKLKQMIERNII